MEIIYKILFSLIIGIIAGVIAKLVHPAWNQNQLLLFGFIVFAVTAVLALVIKK
jgi:uncharacterized membrane protein